MSQPTCSFFPSPTARSTHAWASCLVMVVACLIAGRPCQAQQPGAPIDPAGLARLEAPTAASFRVQYSAISGPEAPQGRGAIQERHDAIHASATSGAASPDPSPLSGAHDDPDDEPTRANQWRRQRRMKQQSMQPPSPNWLEQTGAFISRTQGAILGDQLLLDLPDIHFYGIKPVFGGLPSNAGLSAGLYYEPKSFNGLDRHVHAQAIASLNRYYGGEAVYGAQRGEYVHYLYGRYNHMPKEEFYGVGPTTQQEDEALYRLNEALVGGLLGRSVADNLLVGTHLSYRANRFGAGGESMPQVTDRFADVTGVGTNVDYVMVGSFLEYDSRDIPYERSYGQRFAPTEDRLRRLSLDATSGLYVSSQITHHLDVGYDSYSFTRFSLDLQEYISIDEGMHHGLALRQFVSLTHTAKGQDVPFYRLQSIGGSESLRGYSRGRFRDRNVMLMNAEMRCQVWHWLDMAVFGDAGHVFRSFRDLGVDTVRGNVGLGFRLRTNKGTAARLDIARGTEGTRIQLHLGSLL